MPLITDVVDPAVLTGAAREIPDPATYTLADLLPNVEVDDDEYTITAATVTRGGVASYRAFDTPTPIGRRAASMVVSRGQYPMLGNKLPIGEYERLRVRRAQGASIENQLVRQVYDDTRTNVLAIRARLERARGQVLSTGRLTLVRAVDNGLDLTVDYQVPASQLNVAPVGVLWPNPAADFFGDLERWITAYSLGNDKGELPGRITTSRRMMNLARANSQVIRAIYGPSATEGRITPDQVNQVLADQGFPALSTNDVMIGGVRVIPDNKVILTPSNAEDLGRTEFGITVDALDLVENQNVDFKIADAPGITAVMWKEEIDPPTTSSKATAGSLPVLRDSRLLFVASAA